MYPLLLELGGFRLHSYGVVILVATLVALWLAGREARRKRLGSEIVSDLAVPVILAGFVGARLAYVVGWEPDLLWRDPVGVVAVWRGGLALHGGLLGGFAAGFWFCRRRRVNPWRMGDAVAPALILGQAIGRIACLLSGDSYGTPSDLAWAITFTDPTALAPLGVPLHPTQLYEFGLDLGLFGLLWALRKRTALDGHLFLLYAGGYGVIRLLTETVRGDRLELGMGLSLLQGASLALILAACIALAWRVAMRRQGARRV